MVVVLGAEEAPEARSRRLLVRLSLWCMCRPDLQSIVWHALLTGVAAAAVHLLGACVLPGGGWGLAGHAPEQRPTTLYVANPAHA